MVALRVTLVIVMSAIALPRLSADPQMGIYATVAPQHGNIL